MANPIPYRDFQTAGMYYIEHADLPLVLTYGATKTGQCACGNRDCSSDAYKHAIGGPGNWTRNVEKISEQISKYTDVGLQFNIGEAGFVDLDLDVEHRADFRAELAQLEEDHEPLTPTWTVVTGNGGEHRIFRAPGPVDGLKQNTHVSTHVELKVGGTCPLPPSNHWSGSEYEWKPGCAPWEIDPATFPVAFFELAERRDQNRQNGNGNGEISEILRDGERRQFFLSFLGALRQNGLGEEMLATAGLAIAEHHCDPPWPEKKVEQMAADIANRYPAGKRIHVIQDLRSLSSLMSQGQQWPDPMTDDAYHGVIGSIVRKIEPHSEADPHAILLQGIGLFGNAAGRLPHVQVEADRHGTNLFLALVGSTSSGRKGVSFGQARRPVALADPQWADREVSGLSTGEGVINAIRDPEFKTKIVKNEDGEEEQVNVLVDAGVEDKRLLVHESEFASALDVAKREGNNLSALLRQAWDGKRLQNLNKNSPQKASAPHVSIAAHITPDELRRKLPASEQANGYANRFLFALVKRSKLLPFGGEIDNEDFSDEVEKIKQALKDSKFRYAKAVTFDADARDLWADSYVDLVRDRPGQLGTLLARAPSQVLRIALIYALVDRSPTIKNVHLRAALAVWKYIEQSTAIIFQTATGDPLADRLHDLLLAAESAGLTRTEIRDRFDRNRTGSEIDNALKTLANNGLAQKEKQSTGGRPVERWRTTKTTETTKGAGS